MKVNVENTKKQMRRGVLEYCIISMLAGREMYPTDIIDELESTHLIIKEGTLYPLLTRLKNASLLTYRWEESKSGPPRKYYTLTESGNQFRSELEKTWNDLVIAVNSTTQNHSKNEQNN